MNRMTMKYALLLLTGVFISTVSQVLLKKSALKKYDSIVQEYINPMVIAGYLLIAGTTFLSVMAYRVVPLSMGPILESTSYIYVTVFGIKFFNEKMNVRKLAALGTIMMGIIVYSVFGMM